MKAHFDMLARYNAWANRRLYDAAAKLSDADYRADRGAFFKSVHGTLNHLLVGDRIWMRRFTGQGEAPTRLDAILHEDFGELRAAREAEDARILGYVEGLNESDLAGRLRYRTISPGRHRAAARAGAHPLLQPPDPSPRPGALPADGAHGRGALVRPDPVPARDRNRARINSAAQPWRSGRAVMSWVSRSLGSRQGV